MILLPPTRALYAAVIEGDRSVRIEARELALLLNGSNHR